MQRIHLLCVGKLKISWAKEGCDEYLKRLRASARLTVTEVDAGKNSDPEKQKHEESDRILRALEKTTGPVYLLDETGERMTSQEFSFFLSQARDTGEHVTFVLGGAYGLTKDVRTRARGSVRLSDMTLPHELCRLLFLEQLYRACEIMRGSGYHHE